MFEDIYKKIGVISNNPMSYSVTISKERWQEIKKDPKELLGDMIIRIVNHVLSTDWVSKNHKMVLTDFQFIDETKDLLFDFKFYDMGDED